MPTIQQVGKPRVRLRALPAALPLNIELQATDEAIQWRYVGAADDTWQNLVLIDDIDVEVTVGAVTTLAAGEQATVTNSGTSRDIVLDFGIPAGFDGTLSAIVAGSGIDVDATDPGNPIVSVEANLQSFNSVTPTANGLSLVSAANYAAMKALLDLEIGTDVQAYDADLTSWAAIARAAGFDTFVATPSSANLRSLLTDETGTGPAVFATSPTLTTPVMSDPTFTGSMSGPYFHTGAATIADDAATSFTLGAASAIVAIWATSAAGAVGRGLIHVVPASPLCTTLFTGSMSGTLTTGVLSGTTGADGVTTVSAHTDGKIYIENRTGSSRSWRWFVMGV